MCVSSEVPSKMTNEAQTQYSTLLSKVQLNKTFQRKIAIIFLSISLNMYFGCSKEPSHLDGSFEYPQHMFWLRNKNNNFQLRTLIWGA